MFRYQANEYLTNANNKQMKFYDNDSNKEFNEQNERISWEPFHFPHRYFNDFHMEVWIVCHGYH